MYCDNCGNKLNDNSKFCDKCGKKIELVNTNKEDITEIKLPDKKYDFIKIKQLGSINMVQIKTEINMIEDEIIIDEQKKYVHFISGNKKNNHVKVKVIDSIISKKGIDFFDGLYASIFAILTVMLLNPIFLIITAICLFTGYGEKIFIRTKNNERIMIHTSGGKQTEEFVNNIKKVCNV
ncbi:zinc ribbon domain-containing protein [Clostridium butyricum]|jgi:hypothetical protein|uniref:zinc ribbon domain-containing protein n=1 Tax=Clostridium butyricum TaxID=1492 RepID=UPI000F522BA6|nr:zinc ribbon domain-containing protein [Clostridium butyricum]RQN09836.1 zinc ribbon domain-containing protein [Clostridium butyricum]